MTDRRTFGQAIREARLSKSMSMGQLATAVERSTSSVRRWERDQGVPTQAVVQKLVVVLDLNEAETHALAVAPLSVDPAPPQPPASSDATRATSVSTTNTSSQAVSSSVGSSDWMSLLRDPDEPWLGYLRAALTVVTLLILAWVLVWALRGFLESYGGIWESLWVDAP